MTNLNDEDEKKRESKITEKDEKKEIYNTYFSGEINELEKLLNKRMYWEI